MQLELYNGDRFIQNLNNDDAMLGYYPITDGMRIHVIDSFLFDQNVPKFELTTEQYDQRSESLRSFLKSNKLGKYNEEEMKKIEEQRQQQQILEEQVIKEAVIAARCKVVSKGKPTRFGTVMYNGQLEGKKGTFIGVKYDEPLGTNDGT